jgi:hypothetical protein
MRMLKFTFRIVQPLLVTSCASDKARSSTGCATAASGSGGAAHSSSEIESPHMRRPNEPITNLLGWRGARRCVA